MALADGLISYWALDEASGNATDSHDENTLTDNNSVGSTTGKIGGCRSFSGSNYLSRASNSTLQTGDIDFTVTGWFNPNSVTSNYGIVSKGHGQNFLIFQPTSILRFDLALTTGSIAVSTPVSSVSASTWHFFAAWHDAVNNQVGIQLNGTAYTASTSLPARGVENNPFYIGAYTFVDFRFSGLIDEVGFWKRVLTSQERSDLYNSGNGLSYADITGGGGAALPLDMRGGFQRYMRGGFVN
jgi:hypothetical protein